MDREKKIYVFADFLSFKNELIGTIYVSQTRGKEFYSFEYEQGWIEQGYMVLDPDLQLYRGRQYIMMIRISLGYLLIPVRTDGGED